MFAHDDHCMKYFNNSFQYRKNFHQRFIQTAVTEWHRFLGRLRWAQQPSVDMATFLCSLAGCKAPGTHDDSLSKPQPTFVTTRLQNSLIFTPLLEQATNYFGDVSVPCGYNDILIQISFSLHNVHDFVILPTVEEIINRGRTFCVASNKKCIWWIYYNNIHVCPVIDFLHRSIVFMNVCSPGSARTILIICFKYKWMH